MAARLEPQPAQVFVVPMRRRHLRGVLRIERQVFPRPWSLSIFLAELAAGSTRAYHVALIGRTVVGYAGVMLNLDEGHITNVAVDPSWQRAGIGTRLMLATARSAIEMGASSLTLEVRVANKAAQALYRRFGFKPVGVRKGYYAETGEDALIMWAEDADGEVYRRRLGSIDRALVSEEPGDGGTP